MLDIEPKMILELASGIREGADIAEDYGFSLEQWHALQKFDPFVKLVEDKKTELKASGYTFRLKSAMIAEDIMEDVYLKAKDEESSFHVQLEALKFFSRAAGLDAPVKELAQAGSGFSIVIDLGGGRTVQIGSAGAEQGNLIEHEVYDFDDTLCFTPYTPTPLEKTA